MRAFFLDVHSAFLFISFALIGLWNKLRSICKIHISVLPAQMDGSWQNWGGINYT